MSNKLKFLVDSIVGSNKWYIAGGAAAFWHIDHYVMERPHLCDSDYYDSIHEFIFPSDVEGYATKEVYATIEGKYGNLTIELHEISTEQFNESVELGIIVEVGDIYLLNVEQVYNGYHKSGNVGKSEKRYTRMAMLKLIMEGHAINMQNVEENKPRENMGAQIMAGFKLKPTSSTFK